MGIEIDLLSVGKGKRGGDAIALRYGNLSDPNQQMVVVIDGGSIESGNELVGIIQNHYHTNDVDLVICTHTDGDHSSGLRPVLKELDVNLLWLHRPWAHSYAVRDAFKDGRITSKSLSKNMQIAYDFAYELESIAKENKISIEEPFAGMTFNGGAITILSPSEEYYESLIPTFTKTPQQISEEVKAFGKIEEIEYGYEDMSMESELLDAKGETSGENNSSVVALFQFDNKKFLFTGDAGVPTLINTIRFARLMGVSLMDLHRFQIPHHGSHNNISPTILKYIKAEKAYVSAPPDNYKHPAKTVTNAFLRREIPVFSTQGKSIRYHYNAPDRTGYKPAEKVPFFNKVEL